MLLLCCGRPRIACLILSDAVGASNEPPDDDELDALFDRFLLRRWVRPVSREGRPALLSLKQTTATFDTNEGGRPSPEAEAGVAAAGMAEAGAAAAAAPPSLGGDPLEIGLTPRELTSQLNRALMLHDQLQREGTLQNVIGFEAAICACERWGLGERLVSVLERLDEEAARS